MYKVDLHTHSTASPDGGLRAGDYRDAINKKLLDFIAVTDHNTISFAQKLHRELGKAIIVGEEITSREGEVIGLYLHEVVPEGLSMRETVQAIKKQRGLVYIPHPFETVRKGISAETLSAIVDDVDIIEIHNSRAVFQNRSAIAKTWSARKGIAGAASSDAHGKRGWGRTYSSVSEAPTAPNLGLLLRNAEYSFAAAGPSGLLYPKLNGIRRRMRHA